MFSYFARISLLHYAECVWSFRRQLTCACVVCVCTRVCTHAWLLQGMKRSVYSSRRIWGVPTCLLGPVWVCSKAHWCIDVHCRCTCEDTIPNLFFSQNVRRGESLKGEGCDRRGNPLNLKPYTHNIRKSKTSSSHATWDICRWEYGW